jgi:hypothetical protein
LSRQSHPPGDLSRRSPTKADQLPVLRSFSTGGLVAPKSDGGGSTRERSSAWGQLPWVRFLRSDPLYARLVNTYLLTNGLWVLVIHASFSNRFAYLSWFMMPWILLYPFVPGKVNDRPRTAFIAAILFIHYLFTYFMWIVVYRVRFGV